MEITSYPEKSLALARKTINLFKQLGQDELMMEVLSSQDEEELRKLPRPVPFSLLSLFEYTRQGMSLDRFDPSEEPSDLFLSSGAFGLRRRYFNLDPEALDEQLTPELYDQFRFVRFLDVVELDGRKWIVIYKELESLKLTDVDYDGIALVSAGDIDLTR